MKGSTQVARAADPVVLQRPSDHSVRRTNGHTSHFEDLLEFHVLPSPGGVIVEMVQRGPRGGLREGPLGIVLSPEEVSRLVGCLTQHAG